MILDYNGILSDAQDETTAAAHVSDNVVDLGVTGRRLDLFWYVFRIDTAIVSAGGGTLDIQIITDSEVGLATTPVVIWDSGVIANATVVAWAASTVPYVIPVYYNGTWLRYFGAMYTIGTAVFSAGKWDMLPAINVPNPLL